jgi:hypothetical protein
MLHNTWVFDPRTAGLVLQIRLCCLARDHIPELGTYFKYYTMICGGGGGDKGNIPFYLTFMGPCIANMFQYVSKKCNFYTVYLYLETALHVSGVTPTNHQERIQMYLQHLVFVIPLLLPAAIVEELELLCSSNSSTIAASSSNGMKNTIHFRYRYMPS